MQTPSLLTDTTDPQQPMLRVMALHALAYCERLFYLEEVEEIRVADAAVLDGRRVHEELEEGTLTSFTLEAPEIGLLGKVDAIRKRDGALIPIEVKKGRVAPGEGPAAAWRTDQVQVAAYALLLEETQGVQVTEGRVRYLKDNKTVRIPIDDNLRQLVRSLIDRARLLRQQLQRPPVTENEKLCPRCSLAPVCLPEEERLARTVSHQPLRLFPPHSDRIVVHVLEHGAYVSRQGDSLVIKLRDAEPQTYPIRQVESVVLHGYAQSSTQALRLCADHDVAVQWVTPSGVVMGSFAPLAASAQRHLRQFRALESPEERLRLARTLVTAKVDAQLQFLMRSTRGEERADSILVILERIRAAQRAVQDVDSPDRLLGREGEARGGLLRGTGSFAPHRSRRAAALFPALAAAQR